MCAPNTYQARARALSSAFAVDIIGAAWLSLIRLTPLLRDKRIVVLSKKYMKVNLPWGKISFTLSKSAQEHLQAVFPDWVKGTSKRGLVPMLSYSGGTRSERSGKVICEYRGPLFLLAGQKREALRDGKYYDVVGFPVWIEEFDYLLLEGRVLTFMKVGSPEPEEHLVIENAPENYFEMAVRENCTPCREPKIKQGV